MKKKLNFIFFIDFNENSGLGHLNRCLHLLKYYKSNNITFMPNKEAEMVKYFRNTFFGSFCKALCDWTLDTRKQIFYD